MHFFILAGGFGTRLRSVIGESQKALAVVNEMPLLYHQILLWQREGAKSFTFLLHYRSSDVIKYLKDEIKYGGFTRV